MGDGRLELALLAATGVLLISVLAVKLSVRTGLPSLLLYLGLGVLIGEAGLGVNFEDAELTRTLGLIALALILAEGGLTANWSVVRPTLGFAAVLASLGVAVSVVVTAVLAHFVLGVDWRVAILVGAILSSTDAAAVFSILRHVPLRSRLVGALEAESGFNDAPVVILVSLVVSDAWESGAWLSSIGLVAFEIVVGAVVGVVVGWAGVYMLRRSALPSAGLYPLATMAIALMSYTAAVSVHASGFLAVYLCALYLGNADTPHKRASVGFAEGLAWLAQIGLFVLLGLLSSPSRLTGIVLPALAVGLGLLLLARPLSVLASALPFRIPWREQALLSWAGLRGAVPIVLTTIPLSAGLAGAELVFDVVFVIVIVYTAIQGPSLPWLARRLGVTDETGFRDLEVEVAPLESPRADLLQVTVPQGSRLAGVYVNDLRLPGAAAVTLVVRKGKAFVPDDHTRLAVHDHLLVVTAARDRSAVERRLRAISRAGRLARWFGEDGS